MGDAPKPSVAILVDDLVMWFDAGLHPSGIQRVVLELLDTACASPDVHAWPAILDSDRIVGIERESLRHFPRSPTAAGLGRVRSAIARLPLPRVPRALARSTYRGLAAAVMPKRATVEMPDPDLVLVPGAFWAGDWSRSIARIAQRLPVRMMVYDLFPLTNPEWVVATVQDQFRESFQTVVPHCDRIVAFGETARSELIRHFPDVAPKLRAAVPDLSAHAPRTPATPSPIRQPYLLAVGTVEPRKNIRLVLDAWMLVRQQLSAGFLVIAGRRGWNQDELEAEVARAAPRDGVIRLDNVTDTDLDALYEGAAATVHASWAEGFGLPARESIARGVPALLSSAIPRDGLTSGYELFDPTDVQRLANLMVKALREPTRYQPARRADGMTGWEPVTDALLS